MTSKQWAAAAIGGLLLLVTAPSAPATAGPATSAATAQTSNAASAQLAFRSYGAGPVELTAKRALISFRGSKGDVVRLDPGPHAKGSDTALVRHGRKVSARWNGYWKLPSSGTYTFRFDAAPSDRPGRELQLQQVRVARTALDARPVKGRKQPRGFLNAVSVSLADGERALMSTPDFKHTVLLPDGSVKRLFGSDLQLEVGRPVHTTDGDSTATDLDAGTLLVIGKAARPTRVTRSVVAPITTDGAVQEFTSDNQRREHVFTFEVAAGDVVIPYFHGTYRGSQVLQAPDGILQQNAPNSGAYWFTEAGTVRYAIITGRPAGRTTRLSLSKALRLPDLTSLDTPITLANTTPGQYVAVELPAYPSPAPVGLTASGAAFTTTNGSTPTWSVHLEPSTPYYCQADPNAPLGCGEYNPLTVTQDKPTDEIQYVYGFSGDSLLLAVPTTVSGQVTITLKKPAPPA